MQVQDKPQALTLTVPEAAMVLGISRALAYEAARTGDLPTIRFGRRLVVPRAALDRVLAGDIAVTDVRLNDAV